MLGKAAAVVVSAFATLAQGQSFEFFMDGSQEVPPTPSTAIAFASLRYDTAASAFDLFVALDGIDATEVIGFHMHNAPMGVNGPVVVDLRSFGAFVQDDDDATVTTYEAMAIPLGGSLEPALFAGELYLNLHTMSFPGGEIRGQVIPSPAPVAAMALATLAAVRRQRRNA